MERKVFRGIGAVMASITGDRKFEIVPKMKWTGPTDFGAGKRIPIDLDRTPSRAARWSDIEVDDRGVDAAGELLGSAMCPTQLPGYQVTSLGGYRGKHVPDDLASGPLVGAVYLEDAFFDRHRAKIDLTGDPWPTSGLEAYQLTTVAYSGDPSNQERSRRRYAGFRGRLTRPVAGSIANVELFDIHGASLGSWDFDLSSPDQCDRDPPLLPGERALRPDSQPGDEGALFVELRRVAQLGIHDGKIPIGLGA